MLDGRDGKTVAIGQPGAEVRIVDEIVAGRDRPNGGTCVSAVEHDAHIGHGRRNRQRHRLPTVQTDTAESHRIVHCPAHYPARLSSSQRAKTLTMDDTSFCVGVGLAKGRIALKSIFMTL